MLEPVSAMRKFAPVMPNAPRAEELTAHHGADLADEFKAGLGLGHAQRLVLVGEQIGNLLHGLVHGGHHDVAGRLAGELHDIFASVGFDHLDAIGLQHAVEADLLRHDRLAFGDELGIDITADGADDLTGFLAIVRPMHLAAARGDRTLVDFQIMIQILKRVLLDGRAFLAQRLELGQRGDGTRAVARRSRVSTRPARLAGRRRQWRQRPAYRSRRLFAPSRMSNFRAHFYQ